MRTIKALLPMLAVGLLSACNTEGGAGTTKAHRDGTRTPEGIQDRRETAVNPEVDPPRGEASPRPAASREIYQVQHVDPRTNVITLQPVNQGRAHASGETMLLTFSEYQIHLEGRGDVRAPEPGSMLAISRDERYRIRRIDVLPQAQMQDAEEEPSAPSFRQ